MKSLRLLLAIVLLVPACTSFAAGGRSTKSAPPPDKSSTKPLPSFEAVVKEVKQTLALDREYQPNDLLTASKVERILTKLEQLPWKVADRREIVKMALPDGDWLARQLAGGEGKEFMRQISSLPGGYDRVDRLRHMPYGTSQIVDFIQGPDGAKMIEYMTTTQEGKNLGELLSDDPGGQNFNKSTGRIYTASDLLKRLKRSYDAEDARRKGIKPKRTMPSEQSAADDSTEPARVPAKPKRTRRTSTKPTPAKPASADPTPEATKPAPK